MTSAICSRRVAVATIRVSPGADYITECIILACVQHLANCTRDLVSSMEPGVNPDEPPPAYSVRVPGPSPSRHSPQEGMPGHYPYRLPAHVDGYSRFGPSPLMQSQPTLGVLPYHDPQSTYSLQAARSRARMRFFGAAVWAAGIVLVSSGICMLSSEWVDM